MIIDEIDYQKIASNYGIRVYKIEPGEIVSEFDGKDVYINQAYCGGRDEIFIGIYEDKDAEIACFFHELGHCITPNLEKYDENTLKFHYELDAWMVGLTEAYKYGYLMKPETFKYMVQGINSYIGYEEREIDGWKEARQTNKQ